MSNYKSNVADYDLLYISETDKAIAVCRSTEDIMFWLPKSQVEYEDKYYKRHTVIRIAIPEWLAERHDLL